MIYIYIVCVIHLSHVWRLDSRPVWRHPIVPWNVGSASACTRNWGRCSLVRSRELHTESCHHLEFNMFNIMTQTNKHGKDNIKKKTKKHGKPYVLRKTRWTEDWTVWHVHAIGQLQRNSGMPWSVSKGCWTPHPKHRCLLRSKLQFSRCPTWVCLCQSFCSWPKTSHGRWLKSIDHKPLETLNT